ncbi:ISLre2 family transposase [Symbiobacterium terraclitae]|uniref:ISLre2 family transposase n=1 Tax=Symbiobacterium terraclitae TaxID=557451 RepID=UPI0035B50AF3
MDEIRADVAFSFQELEDLVWERTVECHRESMIEALSALDKALHENRDSERFVYKEMRSRDVMTKLGPISLKRRYYWDREEECYVCLLDEALGLAKRQRVSDSVRTEAVEAAVTGGSFRGAAAELERRGCQVHVSHEAIRQWTIQTGRAIAKAAKQRQELTAGTRRVPVLFIEADGFWPGRQRGKKAEVRLFVIHEGWVQRSPGSQEYSLVNRRDFVPDRGRDSWEQLSEFLESEYDLSETWVIINGDRAAWIREGVTWFPKALYQIDRFHLKRELRHVLRQQPQRLKEAEEAIVANDAKRLLTVLDKAHEAEGDSGRRQALRNLLADLKTIPESIRDYRVRLQERGVNVEGLRGLGAAEGAVERYSARLRKVGRSWSETGLMAMLHVMAAYFRGALQGAVQYVERQLGLESLQTAREKVRQRVAETVGRGIDGARHARMPILHVGRNASGGYSKALRGLAGF